MAKNKRETASKKPTDHSILEGAAHRSRCLLPRTSERMHYNRRLHFGNTSHFSPLQSKNNCDFYLPYEVKIDCRNATNKGVGTVGKGTGLLHLCTAPTSASTDTTGALQEHLPAQHPSPRPPNCFRGLIARGGSWHQLRLWTGWGGRKRTHEFWLGWWQVCTRIGIIKKMSLGML